MSSSSPLLPPKPQAPEGYDCCGGGCADCDIQAYVRAMKQWQAEVKAILEAAGQAENPS